MVGCSLCIVCLILKDFSNLVFVIIKSFQFMNKIEISCFDKRLDFLIDFTKTYKKGSIKKHSLALLLFYLINKF